MHPVSFSYRSPYPFPKKGAKSILCKVPSILYHKEEKKSCTIVENNRTIFTFFAALLPFATSFYALCITRFLFFVQLAKRAKVYDFGSIWRHN